MTRKGGTLAKEGRTLTPYEQIRYGDSKMLRFEASTREPIYPIGYVKYHPPRWANPKVSCYSQDGRSTIHKNLQINTALMLGLMRHPPPNLSIQGADNCISRFSEQWGKCRISGVEFTSLQEIVCHHINPRRRPGMDRYSNIVLVTPKVEELILAQDPMDIRRLLRELNLDSDQMEALDSLRLKSGNQAIDTIIDA